MTLEAERGASTRGAMLDPPTQQDPKLRLEIGICGVTKADGTEALEVSHFHGLADRDDHLRSQCDILNAGIGVLGSNPAPLLAAFLPGHIMQC